MKKQSQGNESTSKPRAKENPPAAGKGKFPRKVEPRRPMGFHGSDNEKNLNPEE